MAQPQQHKVIRFLKPARVGKEPLPAGAVVDAEPGLADDLIARGLAEATEATERYPQVPFLSVVHECPVGEAPPPGRVVYPPDHDAPVDVFGRKPDLTPRAQEAPLKAEATPAIGAAPAPAPADVPDPDPAVVEGPFPGEPE